MISVVRCCKNGSISVLAFLTTFLWSRLVCTFMIIIGSETATFNHLPARFLFFFIMRLFHVLIIDSVLFLFLNNYYRPQATCWCLESLWLPSQQPLKVRWVKISKRFTLYSWKKLLHKHVSQLLVRKLSWVSTFVQVSHTNSSQTTIYKLVRNSKNYVACIQSH